ncbi:MAG: hypothetical protein J3K34DRAFT_24864 [Monoraphidium minutum]|nr:MAG: hypothetical protein J3K34DRAFT_24864 [Monoraphidium minutum]
MAARVHPTARLHGARCYGALPLLLALLVLSAAAAFQGAAGQAMVAVDPEPEPPARVPPPPPPRQQQQEPKPRAGGFEEQLESLLHWAIEHSDPAVLAERAGRQEKSEEEVVQEFLERKKRVKELYDAVNAQPTEADLMTQAIAAVKAEGAAPDALVAALQDLQELVEPIDNANDLHTLGGLAPVVSLLAEPHPPAVRAAAAHVVGTAASNNLKFIAQLVALHPGAPAALLAVSQLPSDAAAAKGLYALGAVVRGSRAARAAFYAASGLAQLEAAMAPGPAAKSQRVRAKALHLLTDLLELAAEEEAAAAEAQAQAQAGGGGGGGEGEGGGTEIARIASGVLPQFAGAALQLLQSADSLRGQETALLALRAILARRPDDGRDALLTAGAEGALREALVSFESGQLDGEDMAPPGDGDEDYSGGGDGGGGARPPPAGPGGEDRLADEGEGGAQYRHYLAGLCADLLQGLDGGGGGGGFGHDEL